MQMSVLKLLVFSALSGHCWAPTKVIKCSGNGLPLYRAFCLAALYTCCKRYRQLDMHHDSDIILAGIALGQMKVVAEIFFRRS